ncbi:uncharacterized protein L3040_008852 [Drepanopeziza brunnea f. sp. 'multigermtubi']|uniref:RhoGEF domain-containing protein n=1 Tax=Marssonina brunnea f. sp. multigermtubi (strain MB_m1) TaxID=1072389 RepID=K1XWT4_MARBU|nr:RhoGEF domain-containing protein [Drepanopeziza brunnea f. sp. 'multigermtubi' MB_m1]EKD17209.1 RhoGEF domain-containing protein [Drepanopeziza brunnea f. sp. 'multigermtubi' MB_m1]KAJ5032243.1 hypothetical protein L3040_008852 [Drepanopeziza brunnea f. sp. 'multigermtubi']
MESGINSDQNFYSRRLSPPPELHHHSQHPRIYNPLPLPQFDARSPHLSPNLPFLTTQNLQAAATNAYVQPRLNGGDPDDFYREYRGVPTNGLKTTAPEMAAPVSSPCESRPSPQSSLRSNGHGTTPKHPSLPQARTFLKPSYRSASSPLDDRSLGNAMAPSAVNGIPNAGKPSVKDLLKRFDQNNDQAGSTGRKAAPRPASKDRSGAGYLRERGYQVRATAQIAASRAPGSVTREPGRKSPIKNQRARFAPEDQHSTNAQAAIPRKARNTAAGSNSQASKSLTNLSPTSPNIAAAPTRKPLFGEVLHVEQGTPNIAYGISRTAARRTSESSLHPSRPSHGRNKSDFDVSPSSPTAWYLGVTPTLEDVDTNNPRSSLGHNRNHSDFQDFKVNTMNGVTLSFHNPKPPLPLPTQPPSTTAVQPPQSRLPMPSKRLSISSDSSSLPSPSTKSPKGTSSNGELRKSEQRSWSPAGRLMTPVTRGKTPRSSPRRKVRNPDQPVSNNASLQAYISAPLPKTSPPLRSSRPRLPISSASTVSPRRKAADGSGSPRHVRSGMKIIRNHADAIDLKNRATPEVPMSKEDFVAKRELIRRAYTKSIHESEQKQIRLENLRRLSERRAVEASLTSQAPQDIEKDLPSPTQAPPEEAVVEARSSPVQANTSLLPLHINTSFQRPEPVQQNVALGEDSPTLGMPGTSADGEDVPPPSAISNATGVTDIDNEPQTEAARLSRMPSRPSGLSSHSDFFGDMLSPEQAYYGMQGLGSEVDQDTIQIMLDATQVKKSQQLESTPTNEGFTREPAPAVVFRADDQPVFNSTITAASPRTETPAELRAISPFASGGNHFEAEDEVHDMPDEAMNPRAYAQSPEIAYNEEPVDSLKVEFPSLHTASVTPSENGQDFPSTPTTDMECESSDGGEHTSSAEIETNEHTFESRDGQTWPRTSDSNHQSWRTDYSVETVEEFSEREEYPYPATSETEQKPLPPPKTCEVSPDSPPTTDGCSPLPSPRLPTKTLMLSSPPRHQLPPISTGDGLGLGFASASPSFNIGSSTPHWPEHSPPPPPEEPVDASRSPPPPSFYNRRPPSSPYQSSANGNPIPDSRRASGDLYSPRPSISTPRSSSQIFCDDANNDSKAKLQPDATDANNDSKARIQPDAIMTEEEKQAQEATRKRLFKRMMGIKELIDTEAVYIKDMNVVEEIYKGTAEACPKLDPGDIKTIFRNSNEVVDFSTHFLDELKSAASSIYSPRKKSRSKATEASASVEGCSVATKSNEETDEQKDRKTFIGSQFNKNLARMRTVYTDFLKNSEAANARLTVLQSDGAVKVWLGECNSVAKDLTGAWDLNALLVKPVQRITRYQLFLATFKSLTPLDHPDYAALQTAAQEMGQLLQDIDDLKKRLAKVGEIVGRKRKESDVRTGIAKAFGRRSEKLAANPNRPPDDEVYLKLHDKFGDDYLRLQVILRDAEYQTREATNYVNNNLRLFSAMELFMRMFPSSIPEIESKWVRFNMSMRAIGSVGLDDHVAAVRTQVIEPVEKIIALYGPPGLAMKKRNKRRLDYEKSLTLKSSGKKIDEKLVELVAQYEALNETLKLELPKLASLTNTIGQIFSTRLLYIQSDWWEMWKEKLGQNLEQGQMATSIQGITDMFHRDFKYSEAKMQEFSVINGTFGHGMSSRPSQSTQDDESVRKGRPSNISSRSRGVSLNSEKSPSLPTPDFGNRQSGPFFSPLTANSPGLPPPLPHSHSVSGNSRPRSGSPVTPDASSSSRYYYNPGRPSTSRSHTSDTPGMRQSHDYNSQYRRESGSTYNSHYTDGPPPSTRPFSGVFHSAMPLPDGPEDSQRSSRASSRDRNISGGYNVLYLAASLFEFNISATKSEAGYPYLTYQAGEIFDVIGEKGELWLAKNQDDPDDQVGWIWSKHFARLAAD